MAGLKKRMAAAIGGRLSAGDIRTTYLLMKPYIWRSRGAYAALLGLLVVQLLSTLAFAWLFGNLLDAAVQADFHRLKRLAVIGAGLFMTSIVSMYAGTWFETVATSGVKKDLKDRLFHHLLRLPADRASGLNSGDMLSHFTNDIHGLGGVMGNNLLELVRLPLIYAAVFLYLIHINWKLSMLSLPIAPLAVMAGAVFGLLLRRNSRRMLELMGKTNSLLNETFHGFMVVRSFSVERWIFRKFTAQNEELYNLELHNAKLSGWFQAGGYAASSITFLATLCLGAYFISKGIMTVGSLFTYVNLIDHLVYPLTGLAGQWAGFQKSVAAAERICRVLETPPEAQELPKYVPPGRVDGSIRMENITFGYDGRHKVFEQFDLQIPAGKVVAIVGRSGAGKTTLFHLLQGFHKPQKGSIWLGEVEIGGLSPAELRSYFGLVPQENFLFNGTVRQNLLLARPGIDRNEMIQAAKSANIHDFILSLPHGYDTEIGERGILLSGGQKQRLAIARAILKDAPILLMDEATSSLDQETEVQVKEAIDRLMEHRTTLVIAHRLSTVRNADLIVVLDQGKIAQMGRHRELIEQTGVYRHLHRVQDIFSEGAVTHDEIDSGAV